MREIYLKAFKRGLLYLEGKRNWINEINFFPVADKDTGDNLVKTIKEAMEIVESKNEKGNFFEQIADALFETATGNSGLILSLFFDGFKKGMNSAYFKSDNLKYGFKMGEKSAYEGIYNPKEGTILTVIKKMSDKIQKMKGDVIYLLEKAIEEGETTCNKTREMLPELKENNVPDAGAVGFLIFWQGFFDEIKENFYEVIAIVKKIKNNVKEFMSCLNGLGESLVINKKDNRLKIHIHTFLPEEIKEIISDKSEVLKIDISKVFNA